MTHIGRLRMPALKLRGTIVLAAAIVFTVGISGSIYVTLSNIMRNAIADGNALVEQMADKDSGRINQVLGSYASAARSIASTGTVLLAEGNTGPQLYGDLVTPELQGLDKAFAAYMLLTPEAGLASRPGFAESSLALTGGYYAAFAARGSDGTVALDSAQINSGDYSWAAEPLKSNGPTISIIPSNGMVYTTFHDMIRNRAGKVVGVSGVAFDAASLNALLGSEVPMGNGFVGVMAENGTWVVNPDPKALGQVTNEPWIVNVRNQLASADHYQYEDQVNGDKWEVTAHKFTIVGANQPWTIIVAVPQSALLADANAQMRSMLIGGIIVLVLGLIAFWLLGNYIANPVKRMTAVMRRIANGEYEVKVPYANRHNEIGEMAKAVEVFRENGLKVAQLTEAEAARIVADQKARTSASTMI